MLFQFLTQIVEILFRVLKFFCIHGIKQLFCQHFVKSFYKCCVSVLIICSYSSNINIVFFKQLCHITFKLRPIITLKHLWIFKNTTLFICVSFKNIIRHLKQIKLMLLIRFCHIVMRNYYFLKRRYMNLPTCLF